MKQLINIQKEEVNGALIQTVNARDLHKFLESKQEFANWIKHRIEQYGFKENEDYIIVENLSTTNLSSAKSRQQKVKNYFITLDMAKELSMVERNAKGKEARQYFIACEKKLKESPKIEKPKKDKSAIDEFRKAKALEMTMKVTKDIFSMLPSLSEQSRQVTLAKMINPIAHDEVIPLPLIEKTYSATEVGEIIGISANAVGKMANKFNLKTEEFGVEVLDKSRYSSKQIPTFRYNEKGLMAIKKAHKAKLN